MKSFNEFSTVPGNGILFIEEGQLLRVYFDIEPYSAPMSENEPEEISRSTTDNQYECEVVDVQGRTYSDIVSAIVNDRYSADDVQALQSNFIEAKDSGNILDENKREEYLSEYSAFQAWRKKAKEVATHIVEKLKN